MTNFTPGETLTADDLNAAFAGVTPPSSDLLGGSGTAFTQITVGSGLVLSGGTLVSTGGSVVALAAGSNIDVSGSGTVTISVAASPQFSGVANSAPVGIVGAGTTISATDHPGNLLVLQTNAGDTIADLVAFSGNPVLTFERANGTSGSPTAVQANDIIGGIRAGGYDGTEWGGVFFQSGVVLKATGAWTPTSRPADLELWTCAPGSIVALPRVVLTAAGHLLAGTGVDDGSGAPLQAPSLSISGLMAGGTVAIGDATPFSHIGTGLTITSGTLTAGAGAGSVTSVVAGSNLTGGTITSSGTIGLSSAPVVTSLTATDFIVAPTLGVGTLAIAHVGVGLQVSAGNSLEAQWQGGTVTALGTGVSLVGGTISATGSGGSVTSVVAGSGLNGGTISTTGTISLGTITATSLLGNAGTVTGVPAAVAIGSGLSLATNGTLTATGSGGSVTSVVAGTGLSGGTITSAGTVALATRTASTLMGNPGTAVATPSDVTIGSGLSLSTAGTLTATGSGGSVTSVVTNASPYLTAGTITSAGTITAAAAAASTLIGNATTASAVPTAVPIGTGLAFSSGTLTATGTAGVSAVVAGAGLNGGTITSSGTLTANWQAGTVTTIGSDLAINSGTIDITTIAATSLFGNFTTASAKPAAVAVGTGLSLSTAGTLTATGGGGSVTSVVSGAGLHAGTITSTGTLLADWNGGTVTALGTNLSLSGGTLSASAGSGLTENIQTASYTIQASDAGKLVIFNSVSAVTATYPALATIGANNVVDISNINTGVVTVTVGAANGTIDAGGTSYSLGQSQFSRQTNNGTNWATERGLGATSTGAIGGYAFGNNNTVGSGSANGFTAGTGNKSDSNAIVFGVSNTATAAANSIVIGAVNVASASGVILLGNNNTMSGSNNLMIANTSSNTAGTPSPSIGLNLLISGSGGGVAAGNSLTATGATSFPYGYRANDHGNSFGHYRGQLGPAPSATTPTQREEYTFWNINNGTIAVSLSSTGAAPSSAIVGNPGTKTAGFVRGRVMVVDRLNGNANSYYVLTPGVFSKGTTAASMTVNATLTAGGTLGSGLVLAAAPTLAADTTNGGFSVGYTPPLANTDTLWAVAWLEIDVTPGIA